MFPVPGIPVVGVMLALLLSCPWWAMCWDWETGMGRISCLIPPLGTACTWTLTACSTRYTVHVYIQEPILRYGLLMHYILMLVRLKYGSFVKSPSKIDIDCLLEYFIIHPVVDPGFEEGGFRDGGNFKNNFDIPKFCSNTRAHNDHEAESDISC